MMRRLKRSFFTQPSLWVAEALLGKYVVRKLGKKILVGKIVETEAYPGPYDSASHAYGMKRTPRNLAEYLKGGHVYIYLVYGMYWQLNIATGRAGFPECVLIRALEPFSDKRHATRDKDEKNFVSHVPLSISLNVANGPGKLCRWLKLDKSFYGEDVATSKRFWFEDRGAKIRQSEIATGPRVGIDYAGPYWAKKPWRFYIRNNPCVSR